MALVVAAPNLPTASSSAGPSRPKKASTYRRVPLRNPRPSLPSSPLRPSHQLPSHSPNVSVSSVTDRTSSPQDLANNPEQQPTDAQSRSISTSVADRPLPSIPSLGQSDSVTYHRAAASVDTMSPAASHTPMLAPTPSASNPTLRSKSTPPSSKPPPQRTQAPYRPGFQPRGLYRPLTDDFIALRCSKRDGEGVSGIGSGMKKVERAKLLRRLEKLIDIHFPIPTSIVRDGSAHGESISMGRRPGVGGGLGDDVAGNHHRRRTSSFFDFDIRNMSISDAGGLWRGVVGGSELHDIRGLHCISIFLCNR